MSKRIAKLWPFLIGTLFILAALSIFLFNIYENYRAEEQSKTILQRIHDIAPIPDISQYENGDFAEQSGIPNGSEIDQSIPDYILNPTMDMPTVEIDGNLYIGTLYFPSLQIELPVMSTWSYQKLKSAPCMYSGSIYTDNAVIAAHNFACHFGRLYKLAPLDEVYFTDVDGNVFAYEVVVQEVLQPTAIEDMTTSDYDLTLFTCTFSGMSRFTLRCNRR